MKLFWGVAVIGVLSASYFLLSPKSTDEVLSPRTPASAGAYCLALRGNGQLQPAHWGALARTVEQLGLPQAAAGGSSATISMLFLEAIASHPLIKGQNQEVQKERASLLLKSLLGFFGEVQKTSTWDDIRKIYANYQRLKDMDVLTAAQGKIDLKQFAAAKSILEQALDLGLLDPNAIAPLMAALQNKDAQRAQFYIAQGKQSVELFGKFKPDDKNLFFRSGLVNFPQAAEAFGRIAAFYSGGDLNSSQQQVWQKFMDTCGAKSKGLSWPEIVQQTPECGGIFAELFTSHFEKSGSSHYENQIIGSEFKVLPTTSVLTGSAVADFRAAMNQYHQKMDAEIGSKYQVQNPEEVKFGYWGDPETLKTISQRLDPQDAKSRRFINLGETTWKQVLSLSPAEPGLASFQEFTTAQGESLISAGGWSDLHPVLVLKAAGCQDVVYVTRAGSESLFAQGIAKRLLGWKKDSAADQAAWSALYDLDNPQSSYSRSLAQASAVLCTNWDGFSVPQQIVLLIEDSYRSSYWVQSNAGLSKNLSPILTEKKTGCSP